MYSISGALVRSWRKYIFCMFMVACLKQYKGDMYTVLNLMNRNWGESEIF